MKLLFFLLFALSGLMSCENNIDKPPSSGTATVLLNQESWNSEIVIINRDASVGWDNIILTEYRSDNTPKAEFSIIVDFDLLMNRSTHPFSVDHVPLPENELDSIISIFAYSYPDGDVTAASYQVTYATDLDNEISFELAPDNPKLVTATWSVELHIREGWKEKATAAGHPDTIRMENGVATFRLP